MCSIAAEQPASTAQLTGLNLETYADPAGHEALLHQRTRVERQRQDPNDRRRVLVELTPATHEIAHSFYAPHMAEAERLLHRYMLEQLEQLLEFVRTSREFNEREAAQLERANREREAPAPPPTA